MEATLADVLGSEATLSKSTVSRVCEAIKEEFDAWQTRDLSGVTLDYLFLDGSHFKFHAGNASEPVLAAWGIHRRPAGPRGLGTGREREFRRLGGVPARPREPRADPTAARDL